MTGNIFLDTNILVYAYMEKDIKKPSELTEGKRKINIDNNSRSWYSLCAKNLLI